MSLFQQIEVYERLHGLIQSKSTGTPQQLAKRLFVSESTMHLMIKTLKDRGAPILYNKIKQCYQYDFDVDIVFFKVEPKIDLKK